MLKFALHRKIMTGDNRDFFLKEAVLEGYKSIEHVEVQFQKGLNVIIGKNASGKTNFLTFLNNVLSFNYKELINFSSNVTFQSGKVFNFQAKGIIEKAEIDKIKLLTHNTIKSPEIEEILTIDNKVAEQKKGSQFTLTEKLLNEGIYFDVIFVRHGTPKEYLIADIPFSFKINKNGMSNEILQTLRDFTMPSLIRTILFNLFLLKDNVESDKLDEEYVRKELLNIFRRIEPLKDILKEYTPIEDVRYSNNYNIFLSEDDGYTVNNIFFEFKIEGDWLPFSSLSDGTKRLFYIISETYDQVNNDADFLLKKIILIEEPELGIHPHQFAKLMDFLKAESDKNQIIITTHSPQALDFIEKDELNRIIIAYSTHSEGTKFRHLNEGEISKAHAYLKEDFLSDYWLYSDLEK